MSEKQPLISKELKEIRKKDPRYSLKISKKEESDNLLDYELFKDVYEEQKICLDIIQRLNVKSVETLNISIEASEILKKQKEDLAHIDEQIDELGSNTLRAKRELSVIGRRLATDKCLITLSVCIFVAIFLFVLIRIIVAIIK